MNPAAKALLVFIGFLLGLSFLFAPAPRAVDLNEVRFAHTSSSLLYFKNIRSFYYDIQPDERSGFILNRLKRRDLDSTRPSLQFTIVNNWRMDESYIYAELNTAGEQWAAPAVYFTRATKDTLFSLNRLDNEAHYHFAAEVYNQLLRNQPLYLVNGQDTIKELYAEKRTNFNAAMVLEDYFKLVNKL